MLSFTISLYTQLATQVSKDKRLSMRVTDQEWEKLRAYAEENNLTMTEVIRFYIHSLPIKKKEN